MYYIQQRCEEYGCTDLIGITDQSERSDLVERPSLGGIGAEVKRDEEYDVGVEKLGYDRRAGSPEPHIFIACGHFELLENECIEQLGNHESRHGTEDDHHAGSEYPAVGCIDIGFYILIDIYPEIGGGGSGSQQHDHKGIGNHAQSDPGKQAHTPFPEVFIDDISHDEYDRPDDGAGGEIQRDMFDPEERPNTPSREKILGPITSATMVLPTKKQASITKSLCSLLSLLILTRVLMKKPG
jgi:hypothetical protein